ncbi:polysaccharide deacetylase family protein [Alkalihalobacillus hwajinpoensis]|uniref:polysaccharide deacetylase family protein n=1 Tax=Guptibacillus hwajinpoensis TaxID=208199 RepID=UPI0018848041|nr:polysaccharide deacetylase family protein [Pseudalkalibacillus hwajinpoensis]MBF0707612.1 polysaccharide deacetylase family protein [Pseudalkalibacillus hwajinpoensis]
MLKKKWISLAVLMIILGLYGSYKLMNSREYQLFGGLTNRVETDQKVVALTFDDGPTQNVEDILPLLDQYHAKATFYVIGKELKKNKEIGKMIVEAGHDLGNHSYSHKPMVFKKKAFMKEEIERTNQLILEVGFKKEIDFRPPNGKKLIGLPYYLNQNDIETITWDLEPDTYYTNTQDKVNYVNEHVKSGSIILLHPMYDDSGEELKTIEGILKSLTNKGYQFITVNELQNM